MEQFVTILSSPMGIHARPAGQLVKLFQTYQSDVLVSCNGHHVDGKNLLGLMGIQAGEGDTLTISMEGPDEGNLLNEVKVFFESHFV